MLENIFTMLTSRLKCFFMQMTPFSCTIPGRQAFQSSPYNSNQQLPQQAISLSLSASQVSSSLCKAMSYVALSVFRSSASCVSEGLLCMLALPMPLGSKISPSQSHRGRETILRQGLSLHRGTYIVRPTL